MNIGRKILPPTAIDAAGNPLPIGAGAPPAAAPPSPFAGMGADSPQGFALGALGDAIGLSPEQKKRWLRVAAPSPEAPQASVPTTTRPEIVPPDQREAPLVAPKPAGVGGGMPVAGGVPRLPSMLKESETTTTHRGVPVAPEIRQGAEDAYYARRAAAQQQQEASRAELHAAGQFAADQAEATNAFLAHEDRIKREQSQQLTDQRGKLEQDVQAIREGKIDPNRWWNSRSTGEQIAGIIGISLAEGLAAKHGGPNNVANRIMHQIDSDIGAQRDDLELRGKAAQGQHNLISATRQQYQDEAQARTAARAMGIEAARQRLAAFMSGVEDQRALADGAAIDANLQAEYQKTLEHFDQISADKVIVQSQEISTYGGKGARGAGGVGGAAGSDGLTKQEQTDTNDLSKELVKSGIPEAKTALDRLLKAVPEKGDIPGIGGIHGVASMAGGKAEKADDIAYNFFGSKQGQEVRQAAAVLFNKQLKDESGAAVSDQELERHKAAFYGARDAESARRALEAYGARLRAIESVIRSGHNENVNRVQQDRARSRAGGGVTPLGGK